MEIGEGGRRERERERERERREGLGGKKGLSEQVTERWAGNAASAPLGNTT
jgi:hypothetical protein